MKKRLSLLLLIGILVFGTTVGAYAQSSGPVVIGTLLSLTGGLAPYGIPIQNATDLAAADINAQGGLLNGRSLVLAHRDDATTQQIGVDAASRLVNIDGATSIVGALASGVTISVAQSVAIPNGVVMISPASTSPTLSTLEDNGLVFRTVLSDEMQGVAAANLAIELGYKTMSIIYVNNPYGQGLYEKFRAAYEAAGGRVLGAAAYDEGNSSYRGELEAATRGGIPDAMLVIGYVQQGGTTVMRQAIEGGYTQRFLLTDGLKSLEIVDALGADVLEGTYGTAPSTTSSDHFQKAYEQKFGTPPPQPYMAEAYDGTFLLAMAIEKAQSTDGLAIRDALKDLLDPNGVEVQAGEWAKAKEAIAAGQKIRYIGASGYFTFDANGDRTNGVVEVWKITGGQIVTERQIEF